MSNNFTIITQRRESEVPNLFYDFNLITPNHHIFSGIDGKYLNMKLKSEKDRKQIIASHKREKAIMLQTVEFEKEVQASNGDARKVNLVSDDKVYKKGFTKKEISKGEYFQDYKLNLEKEEEEENAPKNTREIDDEFMDEFNDFMSVIGHSKMEKEDFNKVEEIIKSDETLKEKEFESNGDIIVQKYQQRSFCSMLQLKETEENLEMIEDLMVSCFQGFVRTQTKDMVLKDGLMNYTRFCSSEKMLMCLRKIKHIRENVLVPDEGKIWRIYFKEKALFKEYQNLIFKKDKLFSSLKSLYGAMYTKFRVFIGKVRFKLLLGRKLDAYEFHKIIKNNPALSLRKGLYYKLSLQTCELKKYGYFFKNMKLPFTVRLFTLTMQCINGVEELHEM